MGLIEGLPELNGRVEIRPEQRYAWYGPAMSRGAGLAVAAAGLATVAVTLLQRRRAGPLSTPSGSRSPAGRDCRAGIETRDVLNSARHGRS